MRPVKHLESASRDYPGAWKIYDDCISDRKALGDWPSWCHCPMAAAYAIISGGGNNTVPLSRSHDIARLAALAAWRPTQGIYRFDPDVLADLWDTPISGDLPVEHLQRLPEWCVYVETPGREMLGFFAHLEYDPNDGRAELRLLLDYPDRLLAIPLHLVGTIEQATAAMIGEAQMQAHLAGVAKPMHAGVIGDAAQLARPLVSLLLYLCAGDAETRATRGGQHGHPKLRKGRDGKPYMPAAVRPVVWETAFDLGRQIREARAAEHQGGSVRGHIRRAHWHSFWIGTGDTRRLDVRWMHPIKVKLEAPEKPTIREVKE